MQIHNVRTLADNLKRSYHEVWYEIQRLAASGLPEWQVDKTGATRLYNDNHLKFLKEHFKEKDIRTANYKREQAKKMSDFTASIGDILSGKVKGK